MTPLILKRTLLQKDNFMCLRRQLEDDITAWEQSIIDRSNEDILKKGEEKGKRVELFQFVLETAWEQNNDISADEKNLIEKIKDRLKLTDAEYRIIEAKLGKFPKLGNQLHTRSEIDEVRRFLQSKGLVFGVRDGDGNDYDIIPEEVAKCLRELYGLEIRRHGYEQLLKYKHVRSKPYLLEILKKCEIDVEGNPTLEILYEICLEQVKPSVLIGGTSPRDGLPIETLSKWCSELEMNVSGTKAERINRIVNFYDSLMEKDESIEDPRELWYLHYVEFASRNLEFLRGQQLISKDIEVERCFEEATKFLFEKKLGHKPLLQAGTAHPDGVVSFRDALIFWDNKSKESPVSLKEHIKQFDGYIKGGEKKVACFLVIGPEFTPESVPLAMQYQVENGTTITLITAEEIKALADDWIAKAAGKSEDPFPLGYLIQPGRFNRQMVATF